MWQTPRAWFYTPGSWPACPYGDYLRICASGQIFASARSITFCDDMIAQKLSPVNYFEPQFRQILFVCFLKGRAAANERPKGRHAFCGAAFFNRFRIILFALFYIDNFFIFVVTAFRAGLVRLFHFMAMRAFHKRGSCCLKICISRIRSLFGLFRLGYRHFNTSFSIFP